MSIQGIVLYSLRAAGFAAAVCGLYALICRLRGGWPSAGRLLGAFYAAALIEITVLRGGVDWARFLQAARSAPQWAPLKTTFAEFRSGAWPFVYHAGGNLAWFVPLGIILRARPAWRALAAGALASAAIESVQWALGTGMADVDDVILNACGALLGWLLARGIARAPVRAED